jgi:orotate phosphoribosyltransferase-like protein
MTRDEILKTASDLINGDRAKDYGPAKKNHEDIAVGWSVIFGVPVNAHQVARAMAWLKIARLSKTDTHVDSYVDAAAYIALAGEIATEAEQDNVKPFTRQA